MTDKGDLRKMIDLNSTDKSLDQLKQLNNQMIFDKIAERQVMKGTEYNGNYSSELCKCAATRY